MLHPLAICGYQWLAWMIYWFVAARSVSRRKFTESGISQLMHSLPLGLGMWLIFRGAGIPELRYHLYSIEELRWAGVALTAIGLLFSVWARVHLGRNWSGVVTLKADHKLIRTGPYRYVRHPIYTGLLIAAMGSAMVANTLEAVFGVGLVLVAFLIKMRHEERLLTQEFGDDYRAFKSEVSALVPYVY